MNFKEEKFLKTTFTLIIIKLLKTKDTDSLKQPKENDKLHRGEHFERQQISYHLLSRHPEGCGTTSFFIISFHSSQKRVEQHL